MYTITIVSWTNTLKQRIDDTINAIRCITVGLKIGIKK